MLAYNRLLTNPEAMYKNYFRNIYTNYGMALDANLKNLREKMKAGYIPNPTYKIYIPKSNGLNRMFTLMSIEDQIVYQAYANKLADQMQDNSVVHRYRKTVFGNLYNGKKSNFLFQQWDKLYKAYTGAIIKAYKSGNQYIASFDLTACYDSINHNLMQKMLIKYSVSEMCSHNFIRLLQKWSSPSDQYILGSGIPQGPQASGVFAEAVLGEYDSYIEQLQSLYSFKYYRYVDDIKVLAHSEEIVKWVLLLLDQKSKELGLFPQSSKISVHKITNILDEIKQISKPLFDDTIKESAKAGKAAECLSYLVKDKNIDITLIKRYFQVVQPNAKNNKMALKLLKASPEMLPSFLYYVRRYPRILPPTIISYIKECCADRTKQYLAGNLLNVAVSNIDNHNIQEFGNMAYDLLKRNRKQKFIFDLLFKEQLILLMIKSGEYSDKNCIRWINSESNWWIKQRLLTDLVDDDASYTVISNVIGQCINSENPDEALSAASKIIIYPDKYSLPARREMSALAQETLKKAGLIIKKRYSTSQINKYLELITDRKYKSDWKKRFCSDHDIVERLLFVALAYWKTDLTAFVNLWDTIDDRMIYALTKQHQELGGYTLGQIGCIKKSKKIPSQFPQFFKMVDEIHSFRCSSYLSHTKIRNTNIPTGPIPYNHKKRIKVIICNALDEIDVKW